VRAVAAGATTEGPTVHSTRRAVTVVDILRGCRCEESRRRHQQHGLHRLLTIEDVAALRGLARVAEREQVLLGRRLAVLRPLLLHVQVRCCPDVVYDVAAVQLLYLLAHLCVEGHAVLDEAAPLDGDLFLLVVGDDVEEGLERRVRGQLVAALERPLTHAEALELAVLEHEHRPPRLVTAFLIPQRRSVGQRHLLRLFACSCVRVWLLLGVCLLLAQRCASIFSRCFLGFTEVLKGKRAPATFPFFSQFSYAEARIVLMRSIRFLAS
jgi:hypothetical protein